MTAWRVRLMAALADLTPQQVALVLSIGLVLGVFPIMGCPTVLCLAAALGLRLNVVALQVVNNISSPLQLALLLPLARAGEKLCGGAIPAGEPWMARVAWTGLHAVTGWASICVPLGALLYLGLLCALRLGRARTL